ncbi:YcxB family protein [uncultured Sphaerochaeta sp.]|uniref:YcxB family protein n=1 Tax=uncultured Sphaerochaeta sp. TaxID=886478 RepID=UPI002A0A146D|nr:YcxB family protein [uncultured Sphaerochaeta sp.]
MTIAVRLSESNFRHFLTFNILKRLKLYKSPVIFASIMSVSAFISFLMHHVEGAVMLGSVLLLVGLGVPVVYFVNFFASLKKQVKLQDLNPPRLVYTIQFSEESDFIEISNDKEQVRYQWKDVYHAYYEKDAIYLFITKDRAFLLPLSLLENCEEVWSIIEKKLGSERYTRKK